MSETTRKLFWMIVIIVTTSLAYRNTYHNQFAYDDMFAIVNNADADHSSEFSNLLYNDFWGQDITSESSHKSYRPISVLSFKLNSILHHYLFPEQNETKSPTFLRLIQEYYTSWIELPKDSKLIGNAPEGYHIVNTLFHILTTLSIGILYEKLFSNGKNQLKTTILSNIIPPDWVICSLLFGLHPIHTEAITGIVGRAECLCSFFIFLSIYFYHKSNETTYFLFYFLFVIFSAILFILSILSKETGFTAIALLIAYEILFLSQNPIYIWQKNNLFRSIIRVSILVITSVGYLYIRNQITVHFTLSNYRELENQIPYITDPLFRGLTMIHLHWRYFKLMVIPWPLSADYSFNCVPSIESLEDIRIIYPILLYSIFSIIIIVIGFKIIKRSLRNQVNDREFKDFLGLTFSIAFLIIPFVPASNIFIYVGTFIGERLLYIPSIGFCLLLTYIIYRVCKWIEGRSSKIVADSVKLLIVICILSWYFSCTYERNFDWKDEEILFGKAYSVCNQSAKVLQNVAILERRYQRFEESLKLLQQAQEIWPDFCEVENWIGMNYFELRKPEIAVKYFHKSMYCKYTTAKAVIQLHTIYDAFKGTYPQNPDFWYSWGEVLEFLNRTNDAAKHYESCGITYLNWKNAEGLEKSIASFRKSLLLLNQEENPRIDDLCLVNYYLGFSILGTGDIHTSADHLLKGTYCETTALLSLTNLLQIQKENAYDPLIHAIWARAMINVKDYGQAINHLKASSSLYLEDFMTSQTLEVINKAISVLGEALEVATKYVPAEENAIKITINQIHNLKKTKSTSHN